MSAVNTCASAAPVNPRWDTRGGWPRVCAALGFRYHADAAPMTNDPDLPGWYCTDFGWRFSWADRLRLLVTGRLHARLMTETDVVVNVARPRLDWQIKAPGQP